MTVAKKLASAALALLLASAFSTPQPVRADPALAAANSWQARFSTFQGKLDCAYGDPDCNRCVHNVERQFRDLTQGSAHTVRVKKWEWDRFTNYAPSGHKAVDILKSNPGNGHFQGFVRSSTEGLSGVPTYFASHSDETREQGGIFFSRGGADSRGRATDGKLKYIYRSTLNHPGGMQAIGQHLLIGGEVSGGGDSKPAVLDMVNIPMAPAARVSVPFPELGVGATAVAVQQVAGGGYLLVVWKNSKANALRLFFTPSLEEPVLEQVLVNDVFATWDPGWTKDGEDRRGFENLTLITECGTGKPFVIAATARDFQLDGGGATYIGGKSVWALYELDPGTNNALKFVTKNSRDMFTEECDPRASGTGFAGKNGELGLYCHQKLQDEATRRNLLACGVTGIAVFLGANALLPLAAGFCGKGGTPDRDIFFTEYWPTEPAEFEVSVRVRGNGEVPDFGRVGVMEMGTGMICDAPEGIDKTCKWRFVRGQKITLIPLFHPGWDRVDWYSEQCANRNGRAEGMSWAAAECTQTVNGTQSFDLVGTKHIPI